MIYSPQRFCFIHIPRTGGNSISQAIAMKCAGRGIDLLLSTTDNLRSDEKASPLWLKRHSRAKFIAPKVPDWDSIYKFAITRPVEEIIESQVRLLYKQRLEWDTYKGTRNPEWVKVLLNHPNPRAFFEQQWKLWGDPVDFYCKGDKGEDLGVEVFKFKDLNKVWPEICEKCDIPYRRLPHLNKA